MSDIETVKMLVNDNDLPDTLITFYLSLASDFIKNYCHLTSIPEELHSTLIQIAAVKLRANSEEGESSLGAGVSSITSVSEAGQSVSWGRVTSSKNFIGDDDLISTFGTILDRFRRFDSGKTYRQSHCCRLKTRRFF